MKKTNQKKAAWILAGCLMAGLLGGCQNKLGESKGSSSQGEQARTESSIGQIPAQEQKESVPMGRYKETEIELPDEVKNQSLCRFLRGREGNLELYTIDWENSGQVADGFRYVYQDGKWERDSDWLGNTIAKHAGLDLSYVTYGMDGNYYLGGTDESYRYHILRIEEDGSKTELLEEVFQPEEGQKYGLVPPKFEVLDHGNLLVYDYREVSLYEPSGSRLFSITKDFSGNTDDARGFCEGNEFVVVQDESLARYNLRDGKLIETIAFDEIKDGRERMKLFGDGAGGIYAANETGLSHINRGGTLWEVLIDGSLNHMGMRSLYMQEFLAGQEEDYYGVFTSNGASGIQIFHYEYDPDMAAVPPSVLTVYSLEDHSTVRQAASFFQSEHPDVRVEVRSAVEEGKTVTEEVIQGLNTELLSGKGADVLILDGLPAESYIEKGILIDLSELVDEIKSSGQMLDNLLDGFREEDGAVYQVPARVALPVILGEEKALLAYSSLKNMAEYQGEKPLLSKENYENLLRLTASLCFEELFEGENSLENRDILIGYLKAVKAIGESNGSKTAFSQEEIEKDWVSNYVTSNGIVGSAIDFDRGVCDSGLECMDGFWDLCIPAEVKRLHPGIQIVSVQNVYFPSSIAGINRSSGNQELAKEFIRCLLSYDVQKEDLYDGFPVNQKALQSMVETDRSNYSVGSGTGDYYIGAGWPSVEEREKLADLLETVTLPVQLDENIMEMIVEGSRDYYDGKQTVEQAADGILRKLSIYLAE